MLLELSIENFAIIDRLLVRFDSGFSVLTGETGAGKSIIVDALQAALGAKTGADVVRGDARHAVVEASFSWPMDGPSALLGTLIESGIDQDEVLILRREISAAGRGSSRVNGRAVPLSVLASIGTFLVDIHGQSEHLSILRRDRQLDVLDRYGQLSSLRSRTVAELRDYAERRARLEELALGQREAEQRLDLLRFQVGEIEAAQLQAGEEESLGAERNLLVNSERLVHLSGSAYQILQSEDHSVLEGVHQVQSALHEGASVDPSLAEVAARLEVAGYELDDIAQELRRYRDTMEYDPARLEVIEERLDVLGRLKRKYGASVEEVIAFGENARGDLQDIENYDDTLATLAQDVLQAEQRAGAAAWELSEGRQAAAASLQSAMSGALRGLGLAATRFQVAVDHTPEGGGLPAPQSEERYAYGATGIDTVSFHVSFNPGEPLRPIERVASGGETSRFLLALKSVLAEADQTATLIFDEVDVGVGGRAATNVGERMHLLSGSHQVISITHLPQIAALADHHLSVGKVVSQNRTSVQVTTLDVAERVVEIAEMMTGTGTEAARRNARELLEAARRDV